MNQRSRQLLREGQVDTRLPGACRPDAKDRAGPRILEKRSINAFSVSDPEKRFDARLVTLDQRQRELESVLPWFPKVKHALNWHLAHPFWVSDVVNIFTTVR
jgi:hypothetical protein